MDLAYKPDSTITTVTNGTSHVKLTDVLFTVLIFIDWLIYENVILIEPAYYVGSLFMGLVFFYKLTFPFILLVYTGLPSRAFIAKTRVSLYLLLFFCWVAWSLVPTIIYGDIMSWLKIIPIFVLSIGVITFFNRRPACFLIFIKILVIYVLSALLQYCLINIFHTYVPANPDSADMVGPFGLFGNTSSKIAFPGDSDVIYIIRLTGFWKEPSNAAGSAFACYFFSKYLTLYDKRKFWKYTSFLCLIAGFLTLSNAGYLAIAVAILFGFMLRKKDRKWKMQILFITPVVLLMLWLALFSRAYFADRGVDSNMLKAASGLRNQDVNAVDFDPSSGRVDLMQDAIKQTATNIIGKGMQVTGGDTGVAAPASAPMFWLFLTGLPGFLFLLLREATLFLSVPKIIKKNPSTLLLVQALIAVCIQQAIYGSWMDPNYLILSAVVIVSLNNQQYLTSKTIHAANG